MTFATESNPALVHSRPFVHPHLDWRIRLDIVAKDVDSITYEFDLRIVLDWRGQREFPDSRARQGSTEAPARVATDLERLGFRQVS
jgi:hypothetical protein